MLSRACRLVGAPSGVLVALATLGAPCAQVPYDYLVIAQSGTQDRGLVYLDPATGVATPLSGTTSTHGQLRRIATVALDPADPDRIYVNGSGGTSITVASAGGGLQWADMRGSQIQQLGRVTTRLADPIDRMVIVGQTVFATVPGGANPGLFSMPLTGGAARQLRAMFDLTDIIEFNGRVYAVTFSAASTSTIVEVDPGSGATRVLGQGYPPLRALSAALGTLFAGGDDGDIYTVDTTTGALTRFVTPRKGPIIALASRPTDPQMYLANVQGEVWSVFGGVAPLFTTSGVLEDIDLGIHDQASLFNYGSGCPGRSGRSPAVGFVNLPFKGNSNFRLRLRDAPPRAAAAVVLGDSRQTWLGATLPIDLGQIRMPGCLLHTSVLVAVPLTVGLEGVGDVLLPVPQRGRPGRHFMAQFFVVDPGATPLGLTASDGAECIVR